ncbi:phenylalanine--tRNA ligase subunit alpha [Candidatus Uhrbacteria bacterium CG_4_9_14_3_um_filter_50_9]|uniref:Phenylalanine--tRNA ligase alpha subunit n=1 Tax=Candidatus Uhrbacteria bacterium CG_4_9_14_3_um_filter_50_9 TaxID=1975035 RepID=A0A2M7XB96_9BACT|nr:MAG: phenylalanine--tRNA ligase subunit alpha [Candidatus Uhrbacteria bacterium CG_4_9_14_3_um_filter_50_9]
MKEQLEQIRRDFLTLVKEVRDRTQLEELKNEFLGRKGRLKGAMKEMASLAEEERKLIGAFANEIKEAIEHVYGEEEKKIEREEEATRAEREWIDITEPGSFQKTGHLHPVSQTIAEITDIFARIGFTRVPVPEVDWDYYAFEALNMPKDHPARDDWETFFIDAPEGKKGKIVAIPHISNVQVRAMEELKTPFRALYIGRAYRRQSDTSHLPIHHQFEVLMVDKGVTLCDLKGVIEHFVHSYFGKDRTVRLRPHHFRFTEPSFEIDISCDVCKGSGENNGASCRLCKEGWLELAGAGMTHPNVLKAGGIDPNTYTALAFAFGIERTLMMREGINLDDIRLLYKNDLRFVNQF